MENSSQMSMLEVACMLMEKKRTKQSIKKIIKEVLEIKGIDDEDGDIAAQLYVDITTSSRFVYMGNEEWDLKERQSLDEWDKDGSAFNEAEDEEEEDEVTADDYILSEEDEEDEIEEVEDDEIESQEIAEDDEEEDEIIYTDSIDNDDYMDEDTYEDYMDDYEDLYDQE